MTLNGHCVLHRTVQIVRAQIVLVFITNIRFM